MNTFEFDGKKYKMASIHQKEWGNTLIAELKLKGDERILDLGCGDGVLTEQLSLSVPNGKVLGIDASMGMIETAKGIIKNNVEFQQVDINEINYKNEFNIIFSNAALHWIKDHKRLLDNAYQALKFQGIILWDFGGAGNCANFIDVIQEKITTIKFTEYFRTFEWPWFMPSKAQYKGLIDSVGFSKVEIIEENKDRYFSNADEMIRWIDQPSIVPFIERVPDEKKESFRKEVIQLMVEKTEQKDGRCFETFRRINVTAVK